jgi:hypothetical protein
VKLTAHSLLMLTPVVHSSYPESGLVENGPAAAR